MKHALKQPQQTAEDRVSQDSDMWNVFRQRSLQMMCMLPETDTYIQIAATGPPEEKSSSDHIPVGQAAQGLF